MGVNGVRSVHVHGEQKKLINIIGINCVWTSSGTVEIFLEERK